MAPTLPDFDGLTAGLRHASVAASAMAELDDDAVVAAVEAITALRHELERWQAIAAAEVARRSRVGFGQHGLAQRAGHSSTSSFLQSVTRASRRETATLVAVGQMIAETDAAAELSQARRDDPELAAVIPEPVAPWFAELGAAIASGALTVSVADAIRAGLGEPGGDADERSLANELTALITACRGANADADAARRAARQARDRIDAAGVSARAERQQLAQFWRVWVKPDGMVRGEFELEPENGMLVKAVFDQLAHPRRTDAAVRRQFRDPLRGDALFADARAERERDAAEGLAQLLRAGASVDPGRLLDLQKPSVRLVVNAGALATGAGTGMVEGHPDRVPLASIHTGLCEGHLPMRFDETGSVLDLGRDERLFTPKQKAVLAVRDGGCMDPDCRARHRGPRRITSTTGHAMRGAPTSPTGSSCAAAITSGITTRAGRCGGRARPTGSSRHRRSTPIRRRDSCARKPRATSSSRSIRCGSRRPTARESNDRQSPAPGRTPLVNGVGLRLSTG